MFDHTHRSSAALRRTADGTDIAVDEAHNDYTERSGPRRSRELVAALLPGEHPDQLLRSRHAIFNVWRPINGPMSSGRSRCATCSAWPPTTSSTPSSTGRTAPAIEVRTIALFR